jgi:hypothetical protein
MTVADYVEMLKKLPQSLIVCHSSSDGVYLAKGEAELKCARWKGQDTYVYIEYEPLIDDPNDDELFGSRRAVVVLR